MDSNDTIENLRQKIKDKIEWTGEVDQIELRSTINGSPLELSQPLKDSTTVPPWVTGIPHIYVSLPALQQGRDWRYPNEIAESARRAHEIHKDMELLVPRPGPFSAAEKKEMLAAAERVARWSRDHPEHRRAPLARAPFGAGWVEAIVAHEEAGQLPSFLSSSLQGAEVAGWSEEQINFGPKVILIFIVLCVAVVAVVGAIYHAQV